MIEIIAEIGINFSGDITLAKRLIREAHACGASVAKFQFYSINQLFPDKQIIAQGRNWYDDVKKTELSYDQGKELSEYCKSIGIEFLASAFDPERVDWLEDYGVMRHKVASRLYYEDIEEYNWEEGEVGPTVSAMCETGKSIIISVPYGGIRPELPINVPYSFLYCVPVYPTPLDMLQLSKVDFTVWDGFSDHTEGIVAAQIAIARGARMIEKHFCLKRDNSNPDMVCSIEPDELARLVKFAHYTEEAL